MAETVPQQNERVRRERAAAFDARANAGRYGPPLPPKMADSAGATGGPSFPKNPMASDGGSAARPRAVVNAPRVNTDLTRSDIYKGATSPGSMIDAGKKPIINMKVGMGNSEGYNRANAKPIGDASHELLGSAVYMMQQKGKSFDEARQSLQTLETFKGLSESGRDYALANFDRWRAGQLKGNKNTMGNLRRASQNPIKPKGPSQSTMNLAKSANSVGILD